MLLVQLRWLAVVGQVVTIAIVTMWLDVDLPLLQMGYVIGFLVALNLMSLVSASMGIHAGNGGLLLQLAFDVAALTVQLYLSGGATNPFISLYLLQITLGAVLLHAWSSWMLVALASAGFILQIFVYRPLMIPRLHAGGLLDLHIQGMFVCFVLTAGLVVFFLIRANSNLRARELRLADLRQQSAEEQHIVRMGLLASGAAHELGTPLATLSVLVSDWKRMPLFKKHPDLAAEIVDMQEQLDRCKTIVSGILMASGEARGEEITRTSAIAFLDDLVAEWRRTRAPRHLVYDNQFEPNEAIVSDTALRQVIFNVFDNALESSPDWVRIRANRDGDDLVLEVSDVGKGFPPDILAEIGRPYRSSKGRPGGGLGLFLVVNVVRKLGGSVAAENRSEGGAAVTLRLPIAALSAGVQI